MKKLVLSALLTSSTLMMLANSAFAKDCPTLPVEEITVDESNGPIQLRTDPATEDQTIPNAEGERAVINDGEILLIDKNEIPQAPYGVCFYPVKINEINNSKNDNQDVLSHKPYWISEKGIKNYQELASKPEEASAQALQSAPSSIVSEEDNSSGWSLLSWLPGITNFAMNLLTLALLGLILKTIKDISSTLDKKITNSFQAQNLKLGSELNDIRSLVGRNKEHTKEIKELVKLQDNNFRGLVDSIKSGSLSLSKSEPLNQQIDRAESTVFGIVPESRQSGSYQPDIAPINDQSSVPEAQQNADHDPFYSDVISQFNTGSGSWFSSQIENRVFGKVQITKNSVLGQMDMGGKITQLELNEQGTLLIYQADNRFWIIPDLTQAKWKRAITDSLFNGSSGQILVQPAEVESLGNGLWQLLQKGEFS
ncbi:MAG: hypothetical protein VKL42_04515 [Snowella sp.]|nr:hypothetical protein [Snowella sp.]